jgi:alcohol dehydrogenase, propanol-preferring
MNKTMQAYRILDWNQPPQMVEVDVPQPGPGEVLIKVAGNGLCHSDIGMMQFPKQMGEMLGWRVPFTLGHEVGGWVERCGAGVQNFNQGEAVVLISVHSDGTCSYCQRGLDNACVDGAAGRGYGRDGGLAHYVIAQARELVKLNSLDPIKAGPLTDAGSTSYHAVKRVLPKLVPGSTAIVIGAGGLGSFAVQFLHALSAARIIVVDANEQRLAFARELGAHETVVGVNENTIEALKQHTGGEGAMAVLDFVGIDATIEAGLSAVRRTGSFALIGAGMGKANQPWFQTLPRDGEVFTFQGGSSSDTREVIALAEAGLIRNEVEVFPFSKVDEAYEKLDKGLLRGRAVVTPNSWD